MKVLEQAKARGRAKVAVTDIDGVMRGKYLHPTKFESVLKSGFGFCDVVLGWDSSDVCYEDIELTDGILGILMRMSGDLSTARTIPWGRHVPFVMGEFVDAVGNPLPMPGKR